MLKLNVYPKNDIIIKLILGIVFLISGYSYSQNDTIPYIELVGFAEKDFEPDIIIISFELGDYNYETKTETSLDEQEIQVIKILSNYNIDKSKLTFDNFGKSRKYYKNHTETHNTKWYLLEVPNISSMMNVFDQLSGLNLRTFQVDNLKSSKISQLKNELYKNAIQNAVSKGNTILGEVNKRVGDVIFITDVNTSYDFDPVKFDNSSKREIVVNGFTGAKDITIGNVRIKYKIVTKFKVLNIK